MAIPREKEETLPVRTWKGPQEGEEHLCPGRVSRRDSILETLPRLIRKETGPELAGHWS